MNFFQEYDKTALPNQSGAIYKGIAFDGCNFYLTCPALKQIIKYNSNFQELNYFNTLKSYTCICYAPREDCFWVSCDKHPNHLFKLDRCFREIDCIDVHPCECCEAIVTGISYDSTENRLLVSFPNSITLVSTSECPVESSVKKCNSIVSMGALSVSPSYLWIEVQNSKQYIAIYNAHTILKFRYEVPCGYFAEDILFNPCSPDCKENLHFYVLATKNCHYSYLLKCVLKCSELEIYDCNYAICKDNICPEPLPFCDALIESVALIETSLSQILHSESEKLQKIISKSDNIDELLHANEEVRETIIKITHLEIILLDKLSLIKDCCPICNCNNSSKP